MNTPILFIVPAKQDQSVIAKAEQLGLFSVPVHVSGSTDKHGHYRPPHMSVRRKRMPNPDQGDMFEGHGLGQSESHGKAPKLDRFLAKHGGAKRMAETLQQQTPEARAKLIDAMAHLDGLDAKDVMARLGMHGNPEAVADKKADSKPTESAHAEGDQWVMPLNDAIAEHKDLVRVAETPSKADDKAEVAEQKAELKRMESAQIDNQGRDLGATKRAIEAEKDRHEEGSRRASEAFAKEVEKVPMADWTEVNGVRVLRSGESRY